ncbi:alpha/beta fold hydrolase [Anaerovorax odorimutans]|uniref:alpha/beta fold hydrolase n=1 Tax=Anaerovorax odorimutans TaxID=109327 RepID=UPI00040544AE|nr:alpha/beta fold hydrolase [Anaerovorax odorimutans]
MYEEFTLKGKNITLFGYNWQAVKTQYVVVLVHGIGEYAKRYERVAGYFNKENISMVAIDLRGHGCSLGKRGHTAPRKAVLEDIDMLIKHAEKIYPNRPIILYGHSMGGNIVLDYKKRGDLDYKVSGYIVTSPWIILERNIPKYLYLIVKVLAKIKPDFQLDSNIKSEILGNSEIISKHKYSRLGHGKITAATALDGYEIGKSLINESSNKFGIRNKPLLLMHGTDDMICKIEGSREITNLESDLCVYKEWENFFHELHNGNESDDGEGVIYTMIEWIKNI